MLVMALMAMLKGAPGHRDTECDLYIAIVTIVVVGLLTGLFFLVNSFARKQ